MNGKNFNGNNIGFFLCAFSILIGVLGSFASGYIQKEYPQYFPLTVFFLLILLVCLLAFATKPIISYGRNKHIPHKAFAILLTFPLLVLFLLILSQADTRVEELAILLKSLVDDSADTTKIVDPATNHEDTTNQKSHEIEKTIIVIVYPYVPELPEGSPISDAGRISPGDPSFNSSVAPSDTSEKDLVLVEDSLPPSPIAVSMEATRHQCFLIQVSPNAPTIFRGQRLGPPILKDFTLLGHDQRYSGILDSSGLVCLEVSCREGGQVEFDYILTYYFVNRSSKKKTGRITIDFSKKEEEPIRIWVP